MLNDVLFFQKSNFPDGFCLSLHQFADTENCVASVNLKTSISSSKKINIKITNKLPDLGLALGLPLGILSLGAIVLLGMQIGVYARYVN